jgi:predicted permease
MPERPERPEKNDKRDNDLDRELRDHLELDAEARRDLGAPADEARFAAQRDFGNVTRVKEVTREMWGWGSLERFWQDVRYSFRLIRRNPGFTAVAVLTIALGIGVNATVFTLANAVLYKNLPFAESNRILYMMGRNRADGSISGISYPDFRDFRSQVKSFEGLAAMVPNVADISDKTGAPHRYRGLNISENGFSVIGQKPLAGRDFLPEDARPGAAPVAILAYGLFETRYASDPGIIGKTIRINEIPTVVIGIMPRGLQFPGETDVWMPLIPSGLYEKREIRDLNLFGKMAKGATLKSASNEMDEIARRLSTAYPATNTDITTRVVTFNDFANKRGVRTAFAAMLGAVGFVLLIACANVANLLLSKAVGRSREISIRSALGASRWRVIRQLLVESLILSIAGGGLGWLAALWGIRVFDAAVIPTGKPPFIIFSVDYTVLAFMAAITLGTGILFGLAPALRLSKLDVNLALKDGGHGTSGGMRGKYLSAVLVITEMSLAVVLLAGAGLMIRSFMKLYQTPIGVRTDNVLTMQVLLRDTIYARPNDEISFVDRMKERLEALPGVDSVAVASNSPAGGSLRFSYELEGAPPVDARKRPRTDALVVSPSYFRVMSVTPRVGRTFAESDGVSGYPVVIVNESFVATFWPRENPLGKRLRLITQPNGSPIGTPESPQVWLTVVGVVPDIVQNNVGQGERDPIIYLPFRQQPVRGLTVVARTNVPPGNLAEPFRNAMQTVDADLPVSELNSLDEFLVQRFWPWRVFGIMFGLFAAIALLLASLGLYAVIAHSVSRRTQEIGVRIALGATAWNIVRLVFSQGIKQLAIGLALGLAAAIGMTRVLGALLIGVSPTDSVTFVSVVLVLTFAGMLGCLIPARRAIRVDPVIALRHN